MNQWEDPAEGMLNPEPDDREKAWREGDYNRYPPEVVTHRWDDDSSGCWVGCLVVAVSAAIVAAIVTAIVLWAWPGSQVAIDCGPEGVAVMNGQACIDREPVLVTYP